MSRPTPPTYKTRNWPTYNEALKRRVSLTIWFDPAMTWDAAPTGKRGRQPDYSDAAIRTCLTMKVLFGMALRQTTGFVESLWRSLKYDCVCLHAWETGSQARAGVGRRISFYNHLRPHAAHGGQPPAVVYFNATQTDQQVQAAA
ncbi:MAG: transposase [Rhodobacter sp.]|nr:transposase [Rhodobacter sp.]